MSGESRGESNAEGSYRPSMQPMHVSVPGGVGFTIAEATSGVFLVPSKDYGIGRHIVEHGGYETPYVDAVIDLLPEPVEGTVYLDVGANMGTWTVPLAKYLGSRGRVVSFEAVLETYFNLGTNVLLNRLGNVDTVNAVVGNSTAPMKTAIIDNADTDYVNGGGFSPLLFDKALKKKTKWMLSLMSNPSDGFVNPAFRNTPAVVLDTMFEKGYFGCPSFMKVDVELHELYVLLGSLDMLRQCKPMLFVEMLCPNLNKSILSLLDSLGYVSALIIKPLIDAEVLFSLPPEQRRWMYNGGTNIVVLPAERAHLFEDPRFAGVLFPIPGVKQGLNISVYDMNLVMREQGSDYSNHVRQGWQNCCDLLSDNLQDLWKDLIEPTTGRPYP